MTLVPIIYIYAVKSPVAEYEFFSESLHLRITLPSLTCVIGLLLISLAMRYWYLERSSWFRGIEDHGKGLRMSFLVPVAAVGISVLVFVICSYLNFTTPLELAPIFWKWHITISVLVVVVLIYLGFSSNAPRNLRSVIEPKMRYLMLPHPSRTILVLLPPTESVGCWHS